MQSKWVFDPTNNLALKFIVCTWKCIEVPWIFKDSIDIQYWKWKIQFVSNIRFNNQLLFTCSPFMHNAITRLNWWSGWGKLHVSQVLKFTQVWSSISAREHWVKQRKGEHWTSRGICKNWNEIKNKSIMIFNCYKVRVVYAWSSGCMRLFRANKQRGVVSPHTNNYRKIRK